MKTFVELREEIDEVLERRLVESDLGNVPDNIKEAYRFINYHVNGTNTIPSRSVISEFVWSEKNGTIVIKGGFGSFRTKFDESTEYPECMTLSDIKDALSLVFV